jgi:hypothetical protein
MKKNLWAAMPAAVLGLCGVTHAGSTDPRTKELSTAVKTFLVEHGDLCMAKYTWPRDLTQGDADVDQNDLVQLPVLERLGLVQSTLMGATRRYTLTDKGQKYYLKKKHTTIGAHDAPTEHEADFCVAHLSLDRVVKWSPPESVHDHLETVVRYTYHAEAADWMSNPEARQAFPIADRIIRGQGVMLMSATVALRNGKWEPVLPGQ